MRILVYTIATTKEHLDEFLKRYVPQDSFDYKLLCLNDLEVPTSNIEIVRIKPNLDMNLRRLSRQAKMAPENYLELGDYDYIIYVDTNISVKPEILDYIKGKDIVLFKHNRRAFTFIEILYCYYTGKMSLFTMISSLLKSDALRFKKGLYQGGVIVRKMDSPNTLKFNENWLKKYMKLSTDRDQISLADTVNQMKEKVYVINSVLHDSTFVEIQAHGKIVYNHKDDIVQRLLQQVGTLLRK